MDTLRDFEDYMRKDDDYYYGRPSREPTPQGDTPLLPCPFCGCEAEIQWESTQGFVSCTNEDCFATSTWFSSDDAGWVEERAVARWNKRTDSDARAADRQRIEQMEGVLEYYMQTAEVTDETMTDQRRTIAKLEAEIATLRAQVDGVQIPSGIYKAIRAALWREDQIARSVDDAMSPRIREINAAFEWINGLAQAQGE